MVAAVVTPAVVPLLSGEESSEIPEVVTAGVDCDVGVPRSEESVVVADTPVSSLPSQAAKESTRQKSIKVIKSNFFIIFLPKKSYKGQSVFNFNTIKGFCQHSIYRDNEILKKDLTIQMLCDKIDGYD